LQAAEHLQEGALAAAAAAVGQMLCHPGRACVGQKRPVLLLAEHLTAAGGPASSTCSHTG
jgi:hypothetical protein